MKNKIMKHTQSELPFKNDESNLFLEVITTTSVFLMSITLAVFFMTSSLVDSWDKGIVNGLTIQVTPDSNQDETELRVNKVVNFFEQYTSSDNIKIINDKKIQKLMSPWLGSDFEINSLPIPKLVEVRINSGNNLDFETIAQNLSETAPYTTINSHQVWLKKLINFAHSVKILSFSILLTVLSISLLSIFYATKTSLGIHQSIIEILHVMGATDDYIAKQYARRSFFIGLFSGIIGILLGAAGLWFVSSFATHLKGGIFDKASLDLPAILYIASVPMLTAIVSMSMAYITVRKTLGKIL